MLARSPAPCGVAAGTLATQARAYLAKALKPDAGEIAEVETAAYVVECHAFTRDSGGGSVTIHKPW